MQEVRLHYPNQDAGLSQGKIISINLDTQDIRSAIKSKLRLNGHRAIEKLSGPTFRFRVSVRL